MSPSPLRILPTLLLSACCCCPNPFAFIPQDVTDAAGEAAVEKGFELATGAKVDAENGRFEITTNEGERVVLGEGAGGVDPRMPVFGHPDCKIVGGAAIDAKDGTMIALGQEDCAVPFDDMVAHYRKQLDALGETKVPMKGSGSGERSVIMNVEGEDGGRFKAINVVIGEEDGKVGVAVSAVLPSKGQ